MNFLKALLTLVVAVVAVTLITAYSGFPDVSATQAHGGLMNWLLTTTMHNSVERRATRIELPDNFGDEKLALAGAADFGSMCSGCHGAPGQKPDAIGQGLNPPAPDLAESTATMTAEELYWITSNGVRMTGMPAWSASHDKESLWPVVAFLTQLPDIGADRYRAMLESGKSLGHHATNEDADHGHGESSALSTADSHEHDDTDSHQTAPENRGQEQHDDGHADHEH